MDLKLMQSLLERCEICGLKTQDKQGSHEHLSQSMRTVVGHPGNDRTFKGMSIFGTIFINYSVCVCKHLLCELAYSGQYK